jgi:aryl-alcohol dehydrogenase-like predicted oxidoreductase
LLGEAALQSSAIGAGLVLGSGTSRAAASDKEKPDTTRIRRRVTLGETGIEVPDISFGTFSLDTDEKLIHYALDRGITHFDTAESYTEGRAEEVLGRERHAPLRIRRSHILTSRFSLGVVNPSRRRTRGLDENP